MTLSEAVQACFEQAPDGVSFARLIRSQRYGLIITKYNYSNGYGAVILFGYANGVGGNPPAYYRLVDGEWIEYQFSTTAI